MMDKKYLAEIKTRAQEEIAEEASACTSHGT
jgi:hypothetical protein